MLMVLFIVVSEGPSAPNNVIIMYRGYIFSFDTMVSDEDMLTPQELGYQLYYIEKWCQAQGREGQGIGSLTTTDRTLWAKNRSYLRSLHPDNDRLLKLIEGSIFVYAFEDSEPLSQTDVRTKMSLTLVKGQPEADRIEVILASVASGETLTSIYCFDTLLIV